MKKYTALSYCNWLLNSLAKNIYRNQNVYARDGIQFSVGYIMKGIGEECPRKKFCSSIL